MKLTITDTELLTLLSDQVKYFPCDCKEIDACCCTCQAKRVIKARDEGELEIEHEYRKLQPIMETG